jgi:hypothetical protein
MSGGSMNVQQAETMHDVRFEDLPPFAGEG